MYKIKGFYVKTIDAYLVMVQSTLVFTIRYESTGNNVGKTTVLKLIDFCLGAKGNIIYTDTENKKEIYNIVKNFLIQEEN